MKFLFLKPAILLTQRLRLLPKFAVLIGIFLLPLMLASAFLLNELSRSIDLTEKEQIGVSRVKAMQEIIWLAQQQRAYQHMYVMGNASAEAKALQARKTLVEKINAYEVMRKTFNERDADNGWATIKTSWVALQKELTSSKDRKIYNAQTNFIVQLEHFNTAVADRSNLTHDPDVASYYLAELFIKNLPKITDGLVEIAGRGAAYIDSGLMEGNEEIFLASTALITRHDLTSIPGKLETLWSEKPELKSKMMTSLDAVTTAIAYLDRTKNEVLNSVDQTSGDRFFAAGVVAIDQLHAAATTSAELMDGLLQARIARDTTRRNMIVAGILTALALAIYFLLGFYVSFSSDVRQLDDAVMRVSSGDLTNQIHSQGRDEMAHLLNAFGGMNEKLVTLVAQVRNGSDTIALTSEELAAGNQHLSSRTEEQAGSLEQITASMEQLTSIVRQNAEHAQMANQLARSATSVAEQGGQIVIKVEDTMGAIRQSANEIKNIITIVDSIAFQTNILALNAAVEAAHAGEGGKGFAVVAAEVRNLAQRSAAAAREINLRIADSIEKVEVGSKQADQAGRTMGEIVTSISRVESIMSEIAIASHEQQSGIEHINQAMSQMDQITQQNAALVEEAAAATESMHAQMVHLSQSVAVFKLVNDGSVIKTVENEQPAANNVMALVKPTQTVSLPVTKKVIPTVPRRLVANGCAEEWEEV